MELVIYGWCVRDLLKDEESQLIAHQQESYAAQENLFNYLSEFQQSQIVFTLLVFRFRPSG